MITTTEYTHRFLARIVIEAETPLAVGSGERDIFTDALVATDVNGLPYIPGTAIAGIFRHEMGLKSSDRGIFGHQLPGKSKEGKGSEIIFTEAKMIGKEGKVIDGLQVINFKDAFYNHFVTLPIRQHVRIFDKGVTEKKGKFDEQVVYQGSRFCFEVEMVSDGRNFEAFKQVLQKMTSDTFRIGSGSRSGFGKIKVVSCKTKQLDLTVPEDLKFYLEKSSSLAKDWEGDPIADNTPGDSDWVKYQLRLTPEDFFLFGSGFGDEEADMTPVKEDTVQWNDGKPGFVEKCVLIPASSIKGAISHRTAFHYNRLLERFADKPETYPKTGRDNEAVKVLFGSEGENIGDKMKNQLRGNLIFSDIIENALHDKILNHVSVDRFTGGAIDGALFSEKVTYGKGEVFTTEILFNEKAVKCLVEKEKSAKDNAEKEKLNFEKVQKAFECALEDICKGMLPLGGGVNRGNGCFTGTIKRNNETIYPKEEQ
jgi:Uncharacterized protein predicted to be involved in DNA repair (RAMP superfamily)